MTRIDIVPVTELHDKHLLSGYRERPRIFRLVRNWEEKKRYPKIPDSYRMGTGHVTFFYNKLTYILRTQYEFIEELQRRGFSPKFTDPNDLVHGISSYWFNDWVPQEKDLYINRQIINKKLEEWALKNE